MFLRVIVAKVLKNITMEGRKKDSRKSLKFRNCYQFVCCFPNWINEHFFNFWYSSKSKSGTSKVHNKEKGPEKFDTNRRFWIAASIRGVLYGIAASRKVALCCIAAS